MKKLGELSLKSITLIQISVTIVISLLFQFIIPLSWQPLDMFEAGKFIQHGDEGTNIIIFTLSQWYFSLSIAWYLKRDNKYLNNFIVYCIPGLSSIIFIEFFYYGLYYDYIHILPLITAIYILTKKNSTLFPKYMIPNFLLVTFWLFSVYFLGLAYYQAPFVDYFLRWIITSVANFVIWCSIVFTYRKRIKNKGNLSEF